MLFFARFKMISLYQNFVNIGRIKHKKNTVKIRM
jgi:hypothetical protein